VTYREAKILVEPGKTSESLKRGIARTVCHELAHMWFGNLATPEYWTQLYLKEGVVSLTHIVW
jgi:puromycin-sensitive aminopeptidase